MSNLPPGLREFDDTGATRKLIYDNALEALQKRFPVEDDQHVLELKNPHYDGPQTFSLDQQKQALMKDRQLRTPIKGTWRLVDKKTGSVMDQRDDVVMHVPYFTDRGTFIHNGNEYSIVNQSRLKPGAYVRKQRTGEVETHVNVTPGTGKSFRLHLEPETGIMRINIDQSKIPIYPLLKTLGITDQELIKAWGPDLVEVNARKSDSKAISKIYQRMSGYKFDPAAGNDEQERYLRESMPNFDVDPGVIARTMGLKDVKGVTPQLLLRATQKMLNVSKGEEEADDRDAPMYSNVYGVEDFVKERIDKDAGRLTKNLLYKIRRSKNLQPVQRGALNPYVQSLILGSGLAMPLEETNPLHTLEQMNRITKLGEGGISSAESVTDEARDVNNGQMGFIDGAAGPEGVNIGIDVRAAYKTFKGKDKQLYAEFREPRSGKEFFLKPEDVADKVLAFPGQMRTPGDTAVAMVRGKIERVSKDRVDYEVPSMAHMMSSHSNLGPMPTGLMPGRSFYASKYWSQYLPQVKGEVPLVDSMTPDGNSTFTEYYGRKIGTLKSPVGGTVSRINDSGITIKGDDGVVHNIETVKDFPFNRLTGISYYPTVKAGDKVNVGDMVAHSNFTDSKTGALNLGVNLKTAIIPARGHSYEDAYTISESAAKKLATDRLYGYDQEATHGVSIEKNKFISTFPDPFTQEQIDKVGDDGVVKPGSIVNKGDPIILAVGPKMLTSADAQLGKLHKVLRNAFTDKSVIWEHNFPGIVTDATVTQSGARVNVKTQPPVQVADKLATRFSLKGVTGRIIPDDKMPRDLATNEPFELLLNPMGIQSRVAPAQIVEMTLGKIAKATGKQIRIPQEAPPEGWAVWAKKQLDASGLKEDTDMFDPDSGKTIKGIGDGQVYVAAFHHIAEKKLSQRGESGAYTIDDQPAKGGVEGSKRFSQHDVHATLAHGATEVVRDAMLIRGNKNENFWKALKLGQPLPEPERPFIYDKFLNTLKAGGINIVDKGDTLSLLPMTDRDVDALSKGDISKPDLITSDFEPIPGGLFDVGKTGGMAGNRWTSIKLNEPLPNPVMEEPVRRILGLKVKELHDVIAGRKELNGLTGGRAIQEALKSVDIDKELEDQKYKIKTLRGANRDNAVKIVGYLSAAKAQGVHPSDWIITKVPVLPPIFRPISRLGDIALQTDLNELYRDLIETNNNIQTLRKDLPESELTHEKSNLYDAVTAAYGLGDPITPEGQSKRLKGAIRQVIGTSPKSGMFQSRVLSKTVGNVARGVVTPDPNLDMDSVGIPADTAWALYKDFVTRRLVRKGYPPTRALELIDKRDPVAKSMLDAEMQVRPVIMDRAPTWHKFNFLAFFPHIVEGHTMRVSPLVTKGYTMDFDGDQANFHVPISDKAVEQTIDKMLSSRNLTSLTDLRSVRHAPSMEMTLGLYQLTQPANKSTPKVFKTAKDARHAYEEGLIKVNDPIIIQDR